MCTCVRMWLVIRQVSACGIHIQYASWAWIPTQSLEPHSYITRVVIIPYYESHRPIKVMSLFPAYQGPRKSLGEWVRAACPQWVTRSMLLHQCYRIHWLTTQGVIKELITHSSIQVDMTSASKQGCMTMVVRTIHTATLYNHFHVLGHKHGQGKCVSCLVQRSKAHMCK